MADEFKDLDEIFPDEKVRMSFTGRKDKKRYDITGFIPQGLNLIMGQKDKPREEREILYVSHFLKAQYEHMTPEWIKENLSLTKFNSILGLITSEVGKSNDFLGFGMEGMTKMIFEAAKKLLEDQEKKAEPPKNTMLS